MQLPELIPHDPPPSGKIRTHLANERTFLAWSRTGFTAIALGLAAAQLLDRHVIYGVALDKLLAVSLVLYGMTLVLVGRWRYRSTAIGIREDEYRTHRRGLEVVWIGNIFVTAVAIVFIWKT
jgi:putative membrane protein